MNGNENTSPQDEQRWTALFFPYRESVCRYLYTKTRDRDLAEDLTQETYAKAWTNREKYQEEGRPQAYLFRIAERCFLDFYRKRKASLNLEETFESMNSRTQTESPAQVAEGAEEARKLRETLDCLSPPQRRILTLRYFSQLKFAEIADILDMPLNTVLSHARRGLLELRVRLGEAEK
ncbi:MAG: RNA polymerase sigma factor [Planctomycetia bacterium]|nr:RNA polymerase sigma factor [Planctomycetia bacterium]